MATGGMKFTGGNYQMSVSLDASKALDVAKELDAVLEKVGTTLRNISRGRDVSALWDQQAASIDNVANALERYSRNVNSVGNAEELIKSLNAFKAWNPEIKDIDIFSQLKEGAEELITTAGKLATNLDSAFDVPSLRDAFDALEALKDAGVDVDEIVSKLGQGDVSHLTEQIQSLERQLVSTQSRARDLQEQVNNYESGQAFEEMREKLSMLEDAAERAQKEFGDFLSSIGYAGHDIEPGNSWGQFRDWFEAIADGSLTAKEAIAQFKRENAGMFDTVSQTDLSMIVDRLEQLATSIEEVRQSMTDMGASGSVSDMRHTFEESAEAARSQNAEIQQMGSNAAVLETLIQELTRLAEASVQSGEAAQTANSQLVQLLSSLDGLSRADPTALESISQALTSMSRMDGMSVGKASMQNLVSAMEALSRLPSTSTLQSLSTVDLRNFNDLHISKASLSNMAEFLPTIGGANVGALQQLANIHWDNLNNLDVSKASLNNLSQFANSLTISGGTVGIDETGLSTLSRSIEDAIQRASQNIKLTIDNVELSAAAQKKIADAAQQAASGGSGTRRASSNVDAQYDDAAVIERTVEALWKEEEALKAVAEEKARVAKESDYDAALKQAEAQVAAEERVEAALEKEHQTMLNTANAYYDAEEAKAEAAEKAAQRQAEAAEKAAQRETEAKEKAAQRAEAAAQKKADAETKAAAKAEAAAQKEATAAEAAVKKYENQLSKLNVGTSGLKFTEDSSAMNKYKAAIEAAEAALNKLRTASSSDRTQAVADTEAKIDAVKKLRDLLNETAKAETLAGRIDTYLSKNGKLSAETKTLLQGWKTELLDGTAAAEGRVSGIANEFGTLQDAIRTAQSGGKTFFQTMKDGWAKFGGWSLVTRSFTKVISTFKQMVTAVKEVDAAMTELRKVTDLTATEYDRFYNNATKMAVNVGAKLSDTINATAD